MYVQPSGVVDVVVENKGKVNRYPNNMCTVEKLRSSRVLAHRMKMNDSDYTYTIWI